MIIEIPGCDDTRIASSSTDWQIQRRVMKNGVETWQGRNFYPSLEHAMQGAYEQMLKRRKSCAKDFEQYVDEINRVKSELLQAMRAASVK